MSELATAAVEASANAAATTANAIADAAASADAAVAEAQARADAAQAAAAQLADAAIATRLGEEINSLKTEVLSWRVDVERQISECRSQIAGTSEQIAALNTALQEMKTLVVIPVPAMQSTPAASTPTTAPAAVVVPATVGEPDASTPAAPQAPKRPRWM